VDKLSPIGVARSAGTELWVEVVPKIDVEVAVRLYEMNGSGAKYFKARYGLLGGIVPRRRGSARPASRDIAGIIDSRCIDPISLQEIDDRWLIFKLRDAAARLMTPYL
jgi:hypothetical protein